MIAEIVQHIIGAIQGILEGVGVGLVGLFETIIYDPVDGLTVMAQWMLVFVGVGVAFALFTRVVGRIL